MNITAKQLLSRFHKVVAEWPVDPSRKGRDLGAYLREQYPQKLARECHSDVSVLIIRSMECGHKVYWNAGMYMVLRFSLRVLPMLCLVWSA